MNKKVDTLEDLLLHTIYKFDAEYIYGRVSTKAALSVKRLLGFNLYNYLFVLDSSHLRHFYEQHFDEEREHKRNQRGIHFDDLKKLMQVINQHDAVELGNKANRIKFKKNFSRIRCISINCRNRQKERNHFRKKFQGDGLTNKSTAIDCLNKGDKVEITEISENQKWGYVPAKGGWVSLNYIKFD